MNRDGGFRTWTELAPRHRSDLWRIFDGFLVDIHDPLANDQLADLESQRIDWNSVDRVSDAWPNNHFDQGLILPWPRKGKQEEQGAILSFQQCQSVFLAHR